MEYKDTIFLPKTSFEMRANLPQKEPGILKIWENEKIFQTLRKKSKGKKVAFTICIRLVLFAFTLA